MNSNKNLLYLILTILILVTSESCKDSIKEIESDSLTIALNKINIGNNTKWVVLLPGLGCHGCIQEGEAFMRDNIWNSDILFVLTNISSLKILQQKIGIQVKDHKNVYVDKEDIFSVPTDNKSYPCIIKIEKGKIVAHEFQSPLNSSAFMNLSNKIRSN